MTPNNPPGPPPTFEQAMAAQAVTQPKATPTPPKSPEPPNPVPDPEPPLPVEDLIPGYLKRDRIHLWGGSPHAGKTTLAVGLARALLKGEPFLGHPTLVPVAPVSYFGAIFTDRPPEGENLSLFANAGIDLPYYSLIGDLHVDELFAQAREEHKPIGHILFRHCLMQLDPPAGGVVFVDVYAPTFTGHSLHDSVTLHRHMILNQQLVQRMRIAIIGATYGSKQITDTNQRYLRHEDRIIGAAPLRGCASTVVYLTTEAESGDEGFQEVTWVPRGPHPRLLIQVKRGDDGLFRAHTPQEEFQEAEKEEATFALKFLDVFDGDQAMGTGELIARGETMDLSKSTVHRYLLNLALRGLIEKVSHGVWRRKALS